MICNGIKKNKHTASSLQPQPVDQFYKTDEVIEQVEIRHTKNKDSMVSVSSRDSKVSGETKNEPKILIELQAIQDDVRQHYEKKANQIIADFDVLEKMVISELRKIRLQIKMLIENELELNLMNLKDIIFGFANIIPEASKKYFQSESTTSTTKRYQPTARDLEDWAGFYSFYLDQQTTLLNLISSNYNLLKYDDFQKKFEESFKSSLLNSLDKQRFFFSEVITNYFSCSRNAVANSLLLDNTKGTGSSDFLHLNLLKTIPNNLKLNSVTTVTKKYNKGVIPIIIAYERDYIFYTFKNEFLNLVEVSANNIVWSSPDFGSSIKDFCLYSISPSNNALVCCLDNNTIVWMTVSQALYENVIIDVKTPFSISLEYSYPHTLAAVKGVEHTSKIVVVSSNGAVCIADLNKRVVIYNNFTSINMITGMIFAFSNEYLAFSSGSLKNSNDNSIQVFKVINILNESYSLEKYHLFAKCHDPAKGVLSIMSSNKKEMPYIFSTGYGEKSLKCWNCVNKELVLAIPINNGIFQVCLISTDLSLKGTTIIGYGESNIFVLSPIDGKTWSVNNKDSLKMRGSLKKSLQVIVHDESDKILIFSSNIYGEIEYYNLSVD